MDREQNKNLMTDYCLFWLDLSVFLSWSGRNCSNFSEASFETRCIGEFYIFDLERASFYYKTQEKCAYNADSKCGKSLTNDNVQLRIVDGIPSSTQKWPWLAYLNIYKNDGRVDQCGGAFLNDNWVLTG